jgi:hypothetical protein
VIENVSCSDFTEPFIQKCRSLAKAKKMNVVDGSVRLAWAVSSDGDNIEFMERADAIGLGIIMICFWMLFRRHVVQLAPMAAIQ